MLCAVEQSVQMRLLRIVVGFVLLVAGAAMVVLPGPGVLTIVAGLAMLAGEFPWAHRALDRLKGVFMSCRDQLERAVSRWRRSGGSESRRP
jgi:putative transmembrane protein PGPGW